MLSLLCLCLCTYWKCSSPCKVDLPKKWFYEIFFGIHSGHLFGWVFLILSFPSVHRAGSAVYHSVLWHASIEKKKPKRIKIFLVRSLKLAYIIAHVKIFFHLRRWHWVTATSLVGRSLVQPLAWKGTTTTTRSGQAQLLSSLWLLNGVDIQLLWTACFTTNVYQHHSG